jgi:hypothetical protein
MERDLIVINGIDDVPPVWPDGEVLAPGLQLSPSPALRHVGHAAGQLTRRPTPFCIRVNPEKFLKKFFAYYFLKVQSYKVKKVKEVTIQ